MQEEPTAQFLAVYGRRRVGKTFLIREYFEDGFAYLHIIPDASVFQNKGVFQDCQALKQITLPDELRYLGSQAFLDSGLESVQFGSQLEEIGEFALYTDYLEEVSLPMSLKRVQRGALMGVAYVKAYEGSACGLISAINAAPPDEANTLKNLLWEQLRSRDIRSKEDLDRFVLENGKLTEQLRNSLENAMLRSRSASLHSKPVETVGKCISQLREVDPRILERLNPEERETLRAGLEELTRTATEMYELL